MPATCAGCLKDIPTGEKFVLWGTEVFHRREACVQKIRDSIGTRHKLEIQMLRTELAQREQQVRDAQRDLRELQKNDREADQMITNARVQVAELEKRVRSWEASMRRDKQHLAQLESDNQNLMSERRVLRDNLEAARAEIARLQVEALKRATDDLPTPEVKDTRDDTEIRFSLLEIDR